MKQHYLPQFYLKGFCDPNTPTDQEPYVWVYSRGQPQWKKRAPKNIAVDSDLYSFTDKHGERNDEIEKILSGVEGRMAELIKRKIIERNPLNDADVANVALFVGFMSVRIPTFHEQIGDFVTDVVEMVMSLDARHPEAFPELRAQFERDTGEKLPDWFGPEHLDPSKYVITPSKPLVVGLALSPIKEIAYALGNMSWVFLLTRPEENFVTSDWPYCIVNPKLKGSFPGPGLAQNDVEVTIPLTSTIALFASWHEKKSLYQYVSAQVAKAINQRVIAYAHEFVVSPNREFPGHEFLKPGVAEESRGSRRL